MKEITTYAQLKTAVQLSSVSKPSEENDFQYRRKLPEPIIALNEIASNFKWCWTPEAVEIFRDLDPTLWDAVEQNPLALLRYVAQLRMWQRADDPSYVAKLNRVLEAQKDYLSEPKQNFGEINADAPIAYFCAEYGVHNSLPIYSGGLGILAGDHLKSASDLNFPLVAVGLFYRYGYFRQEIAHDGWQEEKYKDILADDAALFPVLDIERNRVKICVKIRERDVWIQVWRADIGRIPLYLLDTNLPENDSVDRLITGHLYGGDAETRIVQEQVLGIGGVRFLRAIGVDPAVFHLNEGHAAFSTLELTREYLSLHTEATFDEARANVREKCVFTTHTPVEAGNDAFPPSKLLHCFDPDFIASLKISNDEFLRIGRTDQLSDDESFGMTPFAIRFARSSNGVSAKHGEVSRDLWHKMFKEITDAKDVPITSVTNGVHAPTWVAPVYQRLYAEKIGSDWARKVLDIEGWKNSIENLSNEEVWNTHKQLKAMLVAFIRHRTFAPHTGIYQTIHEHEDTRKLFDRDVLTIGFARRVATYKRWNLILTDLERLLKLVDDEKRPVQFVFAGKAHPQDRGGKAVLQELMSIQRDSHWQRRAVFIEDYDQEVARYLVQGVDVWMNVPRRPLEASGTSGEKAAMNGALNFSILDGWWIEGYNGKNGFAIGERDDEPGKSQEQIDAEDAASLYDVLENMIVPIYYDQNANGVPEKWVSMMKNSLATLTSAFSSDRMLIDYLNQIYLGRKR